jgi:hypothetical protein
VLRSELEIDGLDALRKLFTGADDVLSKVASESVNDAIEFGRRESVKHIRGEFNPAAFQLGYLSDRLAVRRKASPQDLEAVLTARDRPTSLARFSNSPRSFGRQRRSPRVKVKRGSANEPQRGAFFVRLRRGSSAVTAENSNVGLAIRLAPGEAIRNKKNMVPFGGGVYLLYGPSVGQISRTGFEKITPDVADRLGNTFARLLALRGF